MVEKLDEAVETARRIQQIAEVLEQTAVEGQEGLVDELRSLVGELNAWLSLQ